MKILIALAVLAVSASPAHAQDNALPNNSIRAGVYSIHYHATSADVSGPFVPAGVNLDIKDTQTLYFGYVRTLSPSFSIELATGWPPTTKTIGKGPAALGSVPYDGQEIATAKWFSPTILVLYSFLDPSTRLRPYIGAGINYTHFFDRKSTAAGDAANGGPTAISLSDSIGPAATVGVVYRLVDNWTLHASFSMSRIKSDLEANTAGTIRRTTIDFKPSAFVVAAGYSF